MFPPSASSAAGDPVGIPPLISHPPLDEERRMIVETLRWLHARQEPLNIIAVKRRHPGLVERVYAVRPYWGWRRALRDAGLDYDTIRTELRETCTCLICGQSFVSLQAHLMKAHGANPTEYRQEYPGAEVVSEALRAHAGEGGKSPLVHVEGLWSWEYLCDRALESHQRGWDLSHNETFRRDPGLVRWSRIFGRRWDEVLSTIGLDPLEIRRLIEREHLTASDIVERLRERHRAGLPINSGTMVEQEPNFTAQASARFGNYRNALKAAGFAPNEISRRLTKYTGRHRRAFQRELLEAVALSRPARRRAVLCLREKWRVLIKTNPGGLISWCGRLGIDCALVDLHPAGYGKPLEVVEEIRRLLQAGQSSKFISRYGPGLDLAARRYFGSWRATMILARSEAQGRELDVAIRSAINPHPKIFARFQQELKKLAETPPEHRDAERYSFRARWHFLLSANETILAETCIPLKIDPGILG